MTQEAKEIIDLMAGAREAKASGDLPVTGNRHQRRLLAKIQRNTPDKPVNVVVERLVSDTEIIENEDDLSLYKRQLPLYEAAQKQSRQTMILCDIYRQYGVPDAIYRRSFSGKTSEGEQSSKVTLPDFRMDHRTHDRFMSAITKIFGTKLPNLLIVDEDDAALREMLRDSDILTRDILAEGIRSRQETIELMKMHITWLQEHAQTIQNQETFTEEEALNQTQALEVMPDTSSRFFLASWHLFWTTVPWSREPQHLIQIPTASRTEMREVLTQIGRHDISVKPDLIIRRLEFHLKRDSLQRAMSARLRYVADEIKEWAKIRCSHDRIPFLVPSDGTAIFFVCGRDEIYRHL